MSYTTPGAETLMSSFRAYLINLGFARTPNTEGDLNSNPPPLWLDPRDGIPYPGQEKNVGQYGYHPSMVLGAYPSTGIPSQPFEGFIQTRAIMLWYRCIKTQPIMQLHEQLRPYIHDIRNFSMNGLVTNQAMLSRELQRISSDEEGFVYNCEIQFSLWSATWVA
jgi:hypothetical protein